jgi:hypothetical protein
VSTGAFAAPSQPLLDIEETEFHLRDGAHGIDVPVRWHQVGGDPATSVQYLVDEVQMRVRELAPNRSTSGETTLSFGNGGEFALSVALCNADGCSESEPQMINVMDPAGTYLLDAEDAVSEELHSIAEALEESLAYYESIYGPRETWGANVQPQSARLAWAMMAKAVGNGVFNGLIGKGVDEGMDKVMALMGFGSEARELDALNELGRSMDAMHDKMDAITRQLDELVNQIDDATGQAMWDTFRSNDNTLRLMVLPQIEDLFNLINFWSGDNPPTPSLLERYVTDVAQAIRGIRTAVVGHQGTLAMLMEAHRYTEKVSDLDDYWAFIDEYREEWRAVLAQALLSLEYMRQFDQSSYTAFQLASSRVVADAAVEAMWSAGLAIPQHPQWGYLHLRDGNWIMASTRNDSGWFSQRPELPGEEWTTLRTRAELEPRIQAMVADYRPDLNGGQSLQSWLSERSIGRVYPFLDSPDVQGNVQGNAYVVSPRSEQARYQMKSMSVQTNVGGRAARFDPDAIQGMAFGFDLDVGPSVGNSPYHWVRASNPFDAPDARILDARTGEVIGQQHTGGIVAWVWDVEPGSAVTIQLGERVVHQENETELFGPVAEMTLIVPDEFGTIGLQVP